MMHAAAFELARVSLLLGAALLVVTLARRVTADARRLVLASSLASSLLLPALSLVAPRLIAVPELPAPARLALRGHALPEDDPSAPALGAELGAASRDRREPRDRRATTMELDPARLAAIAWGVISLLLLARAARSARAAQRLVATSRPAPEWDPAMGRAEALMRLRVPVRESDELGTPAVAGIFSPVILVPTAARAWPEERRVKTLVHELAHVRNRDTSFQVVAAVVTSLFFPSPFAWLAARRLSAECELAADDVVVRHFDDVTTYADDLVDVARSTLTPRTSGVLAMATRSSLGRRVSRILDAAAPRAPLAPIARGAMVTAVALASLGVACASSEVPQQAGGARITSHATSTTLGPNGEESTLEPALQHIAEEELDLAMRESRAKAGAILVLDPRTFEIRANAGRMDGRAVDVATTQTFVTGSTMKALTLATAFENKVLSPSDRIDCAGGKLVIEGREMHDVSPHGMLSVPELLAVSSNVGFARIYDRVGGEAFARTLSAFGLGRAPWPGAASGDRPVRTADHSYDGAVVAIGEALAESPLQMAAAYAVIANGGDYAAPTMNRRPSAGRDRVIAPETARLVSDMLEAAVYSESATGKRAQVSGVRVAGKTGTAEYTLAGGKTTTYASFVGFAPKDSPRWVVVVGLAEPSAGYAGGTIAAPAFSRVVTRALGQ
jgi:cell division protein FtsI (penicillin-binding protein 3)